jgi:NADH:ubiquinone oxidoreductase subunit B-like Fe-S oxidoreductase
VKSQFGQDKLLAGPSSYRLDKAIGWARKYSLFPYPFATACCAMEYMSLSMSPYDIDRFGALLPRFSPRQADLLMVIGTVNHKLSPVLKRVYEQMSEPKWVMAFGACASAAFTTTMPRFKESTGSFRWTFMWRGARPGRKQCSTV